MIDSSHFQPELQAFILSQWFVDGRQAFRSSMQADESLRGTRPDRTTLSTEADPVPTR